MRGTFKIEKPGAVELTLTITMPLDHWIKVSSQLCKAWPGFDISRLIDTAVNQAQKMIFAKVEEPT